MCGPGRDIAIVDARDSVRGCETVLRPTVPPPPRLRPPRWRSRTRSRALLGGQRPASLRAARSRATPCPAQPLARRSASTCPPSRRRRTASSSTESGGTAAWGRGWSPACPAARRARGPRRARCRPRRASGSSMPAGPPARASASRVTGCRATTSSTTCSRAARTRATRASAGCSCARARDGARAAAGAGRRVDLAGLQRLGGGSLYPFNSPGGNRAAKVAFDRPVDRHALMRAFEWDAPLVMFLERSGYDLAYQADLDTARDPATLQGRRAILVAGHNEYWAKAVRDGFDRARAAARASPSSAPTRRTGRCATRRSSAPSWATRARPGTPRPTRSSDRSLPRARAATLRVRPDRESSTRAAIWRGRCTATTPSRPAPTTPG